MTTILRQILKPRPDNFTPPERTPWGGTRIAELKHHLGIPRDTQIGESWEISGHPDFPNRFRVDAVGTDKELSLGEIAQQNPSDFFGAANMKRCGPQLPFLAKLLNAAQWLSVQVHPQPDYPGLKPNQHSKTEAWYILEAERGAGIYLGLARGATAEQMRSALVSGADITKLLHLVEVHPGETYYVPAGTPHAIGPGLLLYEPQETSATTYRYYDFGRKNAQGKMRELHIEDAIACTNWNQERGKVLEKKLRQTPTLLPSPSTIRAERLLSIPEFELRRYRLPPQTELEMTLPRGIQGLTLLEGEIEASPPDVPHPVHAHPGESLLIPAAVKRYQLRTRSKPALLLTID